MALSVGIVGLPNVGKSTLFNALSEKEAEAANYAFCTIDPNVGIVPVPDPRFDQLVALYGPKKVVPASVEFVDIAGLVKGASKGRRKGQRLFEQHPGCRCGGARRSVLRGREHPARRQPRRPAGRHRDDRNRADPQGPRDRPEASRQGRARRQRAGRVRKEGTRGLHAPRGIAQRGQAGERDRAPRRGRSLRDPRHVLAHEQTLLFRRQREGRTARQPRRGPARRSGPGARQGARRPGRRDQRGDRIGDHAACRRRARGVHRVARPRRARVCTK